MNKFRFWCQKVLPLVYDESISYYEVLCKTVDYLNRLIEDFNKLAGDVADNQKAIALLQSEVADVQAEIEKIKNGEYVDVYIPALSQWIDDNLQEVILRMVKYVFFGLTDDGHFAAYVPESWDFIEFDTDMEPTSPNYGHLLLRY